LEERRVPRSYGHFTHKGRVIEYKKYGKRKARWSFQFSKR
jgi:ribosomal protein S9